MLFSRKTSPPLDELAVARVVADVDGLALTSGAGGVSVTRVEVDHGLGRPASFMVEATDLSSDELDWTDGTELQEGAPVKISMGWTPAGEPVFAGEVLGIELELSGSAGPRVTLRGHDRLHRLARARKTRAFVQKRDSEIAEDLAREHDMRPAGPMTPVIHPYVMQADQSDLAFLRARARPLGYIIRVDDKELVFAPRYLGEEPLLTATLGDNLLEFFGRTSVLGLSGGAEARGWDPATQKPLANFTTAVAAKMGGRVLGVAIADATFGAQVTSVQGAPILVADDATAAAAAELEAMAIDHVSCEGKMIGAAVLRPGHVLEIAGVGQRFSGNYWLTRVVHSYGRGGFTTAFEGRRTAT